MLNEFLGNLGQFLGFSAEEMKYLLVGWAVFAFLPASVAHRKGRSFLLWYIYGYFFSMIALIHALLIFPKRPEPDFTTFKKMEKEEEWQDVLVTNQRISDSYIGSPLDALSYQIMKNRESRNLLLKLNLYAAKKIDRLNLSVTLVDFNGDEVGRVEREDLPFHELIELDITDYPKAIAAKIDYDHVVCEDGEVWENDGKKVSYQVDVLSGYELEKLKELTNKYAFCYPKDYGAYWVCSCSKANSSDHCVLCGMDKQELFSKVNDEAVNRITNEMKIRQNLEQFEEKHAPKQSNEAPNHAPRDEGPPVDDKQHRKQVIAIIGMILILNLLMLLFL